MATPLAFAATLPGPAFSLGGPEVWLVLLLILLFFGASRLPGVARSLGRSVNEFKSGLKEGKEEDGKTSAGSGSDAARN